MSLRSRDSKATTCCAIRRTRTRKLADTGEKQATAAAAWLREHAGASTAAARASPCSGPARPSGRREGCAERHNDETKETSSDRDLEAACSVGVL
mgnify:CR=1 FL=1|jgi:hypothetical protein